MKMTALNEAELSTVSGAGKHRKHKPSLKVGNIDQSNDSTITQAVADADVGGDLSQSATVTQSNSNSF